MSVYEGLIPCPRNLILNLEDVGKSGETIGLDKELQCCGVLIVGAIERPLRGSDRIAEGYRRIDVRGTSLIRKNRPG